jgi:8-oxo-dGTP pyrophosphatase MutT (NUDIX family)
MKEFIKNRIYVASLFFAKTYWRIAKPKTCGGRIIVVTDDKILLVQHRGSQTWNLPGGGISLDKNPAQETLRELYEETKIKLKSIDYQLGVYTTNGEGKRNTVFIFVKKLDQEITPSISLELKDAEWFAFDHLPQKTSPATLLRIAEFRKGEKDLEMDWLG